MDRSEFKVLGKMVGSFVTGKNGKPLTDEEFAQAFPDWDAVIDEVSNELQKRAAKVNACDACGGLYYLHIDYDGTGHLEIERCDQCCHPELDDDDAVLLHRMICGCACPENSEGRTNMPNNGTMMPFPTFEQYLKTLAKMRKHGFIVNQEAVAEERKRTEEYLEEQRRGAHQEER